MSRRNSPQRRREKTKKSGAKKGKGFVILGADAEEAEGAENREPSRSTGATGKLVPCSATSSSMDG